MQALLVTVVVLAAALLLLTRQSSRATTSGAPPPLTPPATGFLPQHGRKLRLAAIVLASVVLAFLVTREVLGVWAGVTGRIGALVGLGPVWITALIAMAVGAILWTGRTKPQPNSGAPAPKKLKLNIWLVSAIVTLVVVGAAKLNREAFDAVVGWGRTIATGAEPGAPATEVAPSPARRSDQPAPTASANARAAAIDAALDQTLQSRRFAKAAQHKIATEIDTPEKRAWLQQYPAFAPSHRSRIASQLQFVTQAKAYAIYAITLMADELPQNRKLVEQTIQEVSGRFHAADDPDTAAFFQALSANAALPTADAFYAASLAAWDRSMGTAEPPTSGAPAPATVGALSSAPASGPARTANGTGAMRPAPGAAPAPDQSEWRSGNARQRREAGARIPEVPREDLKPDNLQRR